jgi:cobalamin biosynthesis protein CobD/CbiB
LVAEHAIRSSLSPWRHQISEYANGRSGWLMTLGLAAWAVSLASTAIVLYPSSGMAAFGCGCAAAGMVLVACFHTQTSAGVLPRGIMRTTQGGLHDFGGEVVSAGVLLAAIATAATAHYPRATRRFAGGMVAIAIVVSAALLAFAPHAGGTRQRLTVLAACLWQAAALRAAARE